MPRLPRRGTRVRALLDELYADYRLENWTTDGTIAHGNTTWGEAEMAYRNAYSPDPGHSNSGMNVSRALWKFADPVTTVAGKRVYVLKEAWAEALRHEPSDKKRDLGMRLRELYKMETEGQALRERIALHLKSIDVQIREVLLEMGRTP